jgi:hypothetical protein
MLRTWLNRTGSRTASSRRASRNHQRRLWALEGLEDRALLSTFNVNTLVDTADPPDGTTSLRKAIIESNAQSVAFPGQANSIRFFVSGTIALQSGLPAIAAGSNLTIQGPGSAALLTIASAGTRSDSLPAFTVPSAATLSVSNLTFTDNEGVANNQGTLTLANSVLYGPRSAGIVTGSAGATSSLTVTGSTFQGLTSQAIVIQGGSANIDTTLFANNLVSGQVIADRNDAALTISRSTFTGNSASAILLSTSGSTLIDSSTIANNNSEQSTLLISGVGDVLIRNSIIDGNETDGAGEIIGNVDPASSFNLIGVSPLLKGIQTGLNNNQIDTLANPRLGPLQDNGGPTLTVAPLPASLAVDAGFNFAGDPSTDATNHPRTVNLIPIPDRIGSDGTDIGAVELQSVPSPTVLTVNSTSDNDQGGQLLTLLEASELVNGKVNVADLTPAQQAQVSGTPGTNDLIRFALPGTGPLTVTVGTLLEFNGTGLVQVQGPGSGQLTIQESDLVIMINSVVSFSDVGLSGAVDEGLSDVLAGRLELSNVAHIGNTIAIRGNDIFPAILEVDGGSLTGSTTGVITAIHNAEVVIRNASIMGNTNYDAPQNSVGIVLGAQSALVLSDSLVASNSSNTQTDGGGLYLSTGSQASISDSTFSGNVTGGRGGAIYLQQGSEADITRSTIALNQAGTDGAGIYAEPGSVLNLEGSIVARNGLANQAKATDISGTVASGSSYNLIGTSYGLSGLINGTSGNQVGTPTALINPLLGPLQDNGGPTATYELLAGSPALATGPGTATAATDQRGAPRLTLRDLGAYQATATQLALVASPGTVRPGQAITVTITAEDRFGKVDYTHGGTVKVSNDDPAGVGATSGTLVNGTASIAVSLNTAGMRNLTAATSSSGQSLTGKTSVSVLAPTITGVSVNADNAAQRSMVRSLVVYFDVAPATVPASAFDLRRTGGGTVGGVAVSVSAVTTINGRSAVTLTFPGTGAADSLADGRYELKIDGSQILDAYGNAVDGDGDGQPGGIKTFDFFRLYGDTNGDGLVDATDFLAFRAAYLAPTAATISLFDVDGDGKLTLTDAQAFTNAFLKRQLS